MTIAQASSRAKTATVETSKARPAEVTAGGVGTGAGLLLALLHAYAHFDLDPSVTPYVPVLVGWIAGLVTYLKLRTERAVAPEALSETGGETR
jgi:hypothetical protein